MIMQDIIRILTTVLSRKHGPLDLIYCAVNSMFCGQVRNYKTKKAVKEDERDENAEQVRIKKNKYKMYKYVKNINPEFAKVCPLNYFSKVKTFNNLYLFDRDTAKQFVMLIIDDLLKNTSFVMETNPGLGILTDELLKANVPFIHLYEDDVKFHPFLRNLQEKYPHRIDLKSQNLKTIYKYMYLEGITDKKVYSEIFRGIKQKKWEEETCLQMISNITNAKFIKNLIFDVVYKNSFTAYGRPSFYITIPPSFWKVNRNINTYKISV